MQKKQQYDLDGDGVLDEYELEKAMEAEGRSRWSSWNEMGSTHPPTFKRILQLKQIEAPPGEWNSPLAVFEATLAHEQQVTGLINDLVEVAYGEHDHATQIFLQWFVSEQVEEEESVGGVLEQLKLMGEAQGGLFMIDRELAKRSPSGESEEAN